MSTPVTDPNPATSAKAISQQEQVIRAAHVIVRNVGADWSLSKVRRLINQYRYQVDNKDRWSLFDFLCNKLALTDIQRQRARQDPLCTHLTLAYSDPVGEHATNRVLREVGY
jgi:hypothetical protein